MKAKKKTVYGSMKEGGKMKKAKGGMKMYKNGGKDENLPEGKMDPKERANKLARAKRRAAIKEARKKGREKAGRKGEERVQRTAAIYKAEDQPKRDGQSGNDRFDFGPESLRRGKRRRISRRLERTAEKAGVAKDKAYSFNSAIAAEVAADDAKDAKTKKKAQRLQKLQRKYRGEKTVTTIGKKKNKRRTGPAGETKDKKNNRAGLFSGNLPEQTARTRRTPSGFKVRKVKERKVNQAINRLVNESGERRAARKQKRATRRGARR